MEPFAATTPVPVLLGDPPPAAPSRAARGVGRPRDPRVDAAVLDATRRLLVEVGYDALSIEAVARRAGVHRPAIYRRWRSKPELVHDAAYPSTDSTFQLSESGDFDRDLRTIVHKAVSIFSRAEVRAASPGLMAAMRVDPDLGRTLAPRLEAGARAEFGRWLARAVRRGDARPLVSADTLLDVLAGSILFRLRISASVDLERFEHELVVAMRHLLTAAPQRARSRPAARKTKTRARR